MSEEIEVLKTVARRLESAAIPYMITGSIAANFYATPRMTRDIDIVIQVKASDAKRLVKMFEEEFYIDSDAVDQAIRDRGMFNIIHNEMVLKVDFIIQKDSEYRQVEFERRRSIDLDGLKLWIVSPEDLVLSKLDWAKESLSEMQLKDVKSILQSSSNIDKIYLDKWIISMGLQEVYNKART